MNKTKKTGINEDSEAIEVDTFVNPLYDLIYCSIDEAKELLEIYPEAKTSDASDFIHEDRFDITVNDSKKDYLKNIIKTGLSEVSFMCQTALITKEEQPLIEEILNELKAG